MFALFLLYISNASKIFDVDNNGFWREKIFHSAQRNTWS